jgi:hypothetical protein
MTKSKSNKNLKAKYDFSLLVITHLSVTEITTPSKKKKKKVDALFIEL